jgi:large subunit ribosomal protein L21
MYAVIETGGKQVRVQKGDVVRVEALKAEVGAEVIFDRVLMLGGERNVKLGAPVLDGVRVRGSVVEHGRHPRIRVYTYKKTQNSNRRTHGHRQAFTAVKIEAIES